MSLRVALDRRVRRVRKLFSGGATLPLPGAAGMPRVKGVTVRYAARVLVFFVLPLAYFALSVRAVWKGHGARRVSGELFVPLKSRGEGVGVGIVAACKNRGAQLAEVLQTWVKVIGVQEIVVVDWSSTPELDVGGTKNVKVVRVDDEDGWMLSRAYNLGVAMSNAEWVIRVDCDCSLAPGFVEAHNMETGTGATHFWSGSWEHARNVNEVHLNGAMLVRRADFLAVGGYDERIQTYGWEDEELYARLVHAGHERRVLNFSHVQHIPHGDALRIGADVPFVDVNIDYNSLLLKHLPLWRGLGTPPALGNTTVEGAPSPALPQSSYNRLVSSNEETEGKLRFRAATFPLSVSDLVDTAARAAAWELSLGRRIHDTFDVPWDMMTHMQAPAREGLLRGLLALREKRRLQLPEASRIELARSGGIKPAESPKLLVVHGMHGLGNRLRAIGSAMAWAEATNRQLVVVWERDPHCGALFTDLFENVTSSGVPIVVTERLGVSWPFQDAERYDSSWRTWETFNYMEMEGHGAVKDAVIPDNPDKHLYFKGAYVMVPPRRHITGWDVANAQLRTLVPVVSVGNLLKTLRGADLHSRIGVHIRSLPLSADITGVDGTHEYGTSGADILSYWRARTSAEAFIAEMKAIMSADKSARFFVAADSSSAFDKVFSALPGHVVRLDDKGFCSGNGRETQCMQVALAEMLALAQTKSVMGSMWSSYTEAVSRMAPVRSKDDKLNVRLAGVDFGVKAGDGALPESEAVQLMLSKLAEKRKRENKRRRQHH